MSLLSRAQQMVLMVALSLVLVSAEWVDIETPLDKRTTTSRVDGTVYHLVRRRCVVCVCVRDSLPWEPR
jgi:hypothetical protein